MKQKILAAALACAMLFALLPAAAWAENEQPAPAEPTSQAQQEQAEPAPVEPPVTEPVPEQQPAEGSIAASSQSAESETEPSAPANGPEVKEPLLKFDGRFLYTRGTPVTITKNGEGIDVTYMRTAEESETITYAGNDAVIFGGGKDEEHYSQAFIALNSGTVSTIYGGGRGEDYSADVNEATIIVNGGTVTNCVYGGGLNRSIVKSASITVNDGTIAKYALGGGAMDNTFGSHKDQKPSFSTALDGTAVNRTLKTSVVMHGGTVSYLMGGGQNHSYVGESSVTLAGGTCKELSAGGSNGYTAKSTVTMTGGSVTDYLHIINRGAVGDVVLNLNSGTIKDLYYGWNPGDQSGQGPTDISNGGGVRSSLTVYYKGATVSGATDKTSGIFENAKVVEVKTNTAKPDPVAPDAKDEEKQAKVDEAIENAVNDPITPAKSGSTVVTTTLGNNDPTAQNLLNHPAMTAPEEGFAEIVKNMAVGDADGTLVLSKNISAVNTDDKGNLTSLVFDVAPIYVSGGTATRWSDLKGAPLTFRLPLPADWATDYATVKHTHGGKVTTTEVSIKAAEDGSKYVELTSSTFSPFEISPLKALTPAPKPDQGSGGGNTTPAKTVVVSLLDATPKTGASFAMPALLLAACGLLGLGVTTARRKEQ